MISVCMATYNGELYIEEQLRSILAQLTESDEVIICDDSSTDLTIEIVKSVGDSRINIYQNDSNVGYVKNFENCLSLASGDYVFLTDQDDIWPEQRVKSMVEQINASGKSILVGNLEVFDKDCCERRRFYCNLKMEHNRSGIRNIGRMFLGGIPYFGCCMLLKKNSLSYILPFQNLEVSHDIWIALVGNLKNDIFHSEEVVLYRREHGGNLTQSKGRSFLKKLKTRFDWFSVLFKFFFKSLMK